MAAILFDKVMVHADMADPRYQQMLGSYADSLAFALPRDMRVSGTIKLISADSDFLLDNPKYRNQSDPYRASLLDYLVGERRKGIRVVPLSDWKLMSVASEREAGDMGYSACLQSVPVVDISKVSWRQIREIRNDPRSKRGLRDLSNWLRDGFSATSYDHALDVIATKVDAYHDAIKKHGMETRLGVYQYLLDWKNIAAILAGLGLSAASTVPLLGLVGTSTFVVGNVAAKILEHRIIAQKELNKDHGPIEFLLNLSAELDATTVRLEGSKLTFGLDTANMTARDISHLMTF